MEKLAKPLGEPLSYHFGIYQENNFIGWSTGVQESDSSYTMINTGILKEHQGKGLYTALLPVVIKHLSLLGFQTITKRSQPTSFSRHL